MNKPTQDDFDRLIIEQKELREHFQRRDVPVHIAVAAMLETLAVLSIAPGDKAKSRAAMNEVIIRLKQFHETMLEA